MAVARGGETRSAADGFVGRDADVERVVALLMRPIGLVTLVGPGGIGKTRLAMEVGNRIRKARRGRVHWVRLARLAKSAPPAEIEDAIVSAVVDGDFSGRPVREALIAALDRPDAAGRGGHTVLVLDNCEHVLDGVGAVVAQLLDAVPTMSVLATSRTAIGWVDERILPLAPLTTEAATDLFRRRAELTGRPLSGLDQAMIESICRHLHNYPLFIRLGAARLRYQPLRAVLRDLDGADDRRLRWAPGFRVGDDERHRDISTVIGWSFDLCGAEERLLFERMSVFAAGYDIDPGELDFRTADGTSAHEIGVDLDAVETICADAALARREIEPLLEKLADRSMVTIHLGADSVRYSLPESFRIFARERIRERGDGEWERLGARHRRYYRDRLVAIAWVGSHEQQLLSWARAAWDDLLDAVDSSLTDPDEAVVGLEIATALIALRLPFLRGQLRESRGLTERSVAAVQAFGSGSMQLEMSAWTFIGWLALCQGCSADAGRILDECVAICAPAAAWAGRDTDPEADLGLPASVEYLWGSTLLLVHSDPHATTVLARAREKFTAIGDPGSVAMTELFESLAAAFFGTPDQALETTRRHLRHMRESGAQWAISWAELAAAIAETAHGDPARATALCDSAVRWQLPMRDQWGGVWTLHIRSWIAARTIRDHRHDAPAEIRDQAKRIARSAGEAAALRDRLGIDLTNLRPFAEETAKAADLAREVLGAVGFEAAEAEGRARGEVLRLVPGSDGNGSGIDGYGSGGEVAGASHGGDTGQDGNSAAAAGSPYWQDLTAAEQHVAVLAAAGLTNTAIAMRRGTSSRTVDAQIAAILPKLVIGSRTEIMANLPAEQRDAAHREAQSRHTGTRT